MRPLLTRAQGRVVRALVLFLSKDGKRSVSKAGGEVLIETISSREWASLTFFGRRHHLVIRFPVLVRKIDFADAPFDLPGTIVAVEQAVWTEAEDGLRLTIDLLVIADTH